MSRGTRAQRTGFTLLELLTVMAIIAVLLVTGTASFFGIGKGARMRGAVNTMRTGIGLARQTAILQGQALDVQLFKVDRFSTGHPEDLTYGYRVVRQGTSVVIGQPGYLPRGIKISEAETYGKKWVTFYPAGGAGGVSAKIPQTRTLQQVDGVGAPVKLTIYPLTGLLEVH